MRNFLFCLLGLISFQAIGQRPPTKVEVTNFPTTQAGSPISGTPVVTLANPVTVVTVANPVTSVGITGTPTVTVSNPVSTVTVANPVTSVGITGTPTVTVSNPVSTVTVANPVTSVGITGTPTVTVSNPVSTVTVANPVTSVGITGTPTVTVSNPVSTVTVANPVTSVGITGTPTVTVSNPVSTVTVANPVNSVTVAGSVAARERSTAYARDKEGRQINYPLQVTTLANAMINIYGNMTTGVNYLTAPNAVSVAANTLIQITNFAATLIPDPGRKEVIRKLVFTGNMDFGLYLQKQFNMYSTTNLYGKTGAISQGTVLQPMYKNQFNTAGGEVVFEFTADDPLIIKYGERIVPYYSRPNSGTITTVQSPNLAMSIIGRDMTNDDNDTAPYRGVFFGDSKEWITPDGAQNQNDFGHFIIRDSLEYYGLNNQVINIAISGSDVSDWKWQADNGRFDGIPASYYHQNLGTNDCLTSTYLSSGGVDGLFKQGLKSLWRKLKLLNPDAPIFVNNIGPTDLTARQANIAAYRAEIVSAVSEMQALGYKVYLCDISNSFPVSDPTYFVSTEQTAGNKTHESIKGFRADLNIIWPVIKANINQIKPAWIRQN